MHSGVGTSNWGRVGGDRRMDLKLKCVAAEAILCDDDNLQFSQEEGPQSYIHGDRR